MTIVRDMIGQALKRIRIVAAGDTMSADEANDGLIALNQMIYGWATDGVDVQHQGFAINDLFSLWVPPKNLDPVGSRSTVMDLITYQGTWDASINSPIIASGFGNAGDLYRVLNPGNITIDLVSYPVAGSFVVFNGYQWMSGDSAAKREQAVVALLAVRLAEDYGADVTPKVTADAVNGWQSLLQAFTRVPDATFDTALIRTPSRQWPYAVPASDNGGIAPNTSGTDNWSETDW